MEQRTVYSGQELYTGKVDIYFKSGETVYRHISGHNRGLSGLFDLFMRALQGQSLVDRQPNKLYLFKEVSGEYVQLFDFGIQRDGQIKVTQDAQGAHTATLNFLIPASMVPQESSAIAKLLVKNNLGDDCMEISLSGDKRIFQEVDGNTSVSISWQLTLNNSTQTEE